MLESKGNIKTVLAINPDYISPKSEGEISAEKETSAGIQTSTNELLGGEIAIFRWMQGVDEYGRAQWEAKSEFVPEFVLFRDRKSGKALPGSITLPWTDFFPAAIIAQPWFPHGEGITFTYQELTLMLQKAETYTKFAQQTKEIEPLDDNFNFKKRKQPSPEVVSPRTKKSMRKKRLKAQEELEAKDPTHSEPGRKSTASDLPHRRLSGRWPAATAKEYGEEDSV